MFAEEWSLILFTLLTQLAVGVFILLTAVRVSLVKENENQLAAKLTDKGFLAAGILMALAMVISLFHLGTPGGAYRPFSIWAVPGSAVRSSLPACSLPLPLPVIIWREKTAFMLSWPGSALWWGCW